VRTEAPAALNARKTDINPHQTRTVPNKATSTTRKGSFSIHDKRTHPVAPKEKVGGKQRGRGLRKVENCRD